MEVAYHENYYFSEPRQLEGAALIQAARVHCLPHSHIPPHVHLNWFELTVATQGAGIVYTGDTEIPIEEGDIYLSFPADCHAIRSDGTRPLRYDCLSFRCDSPSEAARLETVMTVYRAPESRKFTDAHIPTLVRAVLEELQAEQSDSSAVLSHLVQLTALSLLRKLQASPPRTSEEQATQPELFCYRVMNYIDTHIFTLSNLSELSAVTNYSYSYLSRQFRAGAKCTVQEYYQSSRMKTARLLLREGRMKVGQIAELMHYASIYAFSKAYKQYYGVSPTQLGEEPQIRDVVTARIPGAADI